MAAVPRDSIAEVHVRTRQRAQAVDLMAQAAGVAIALTEATTSEATPTLLDGSEAATSIDDKATILPPLEKANIAVICTDPQTRDEVQEARELTTTGSLTRAKDIIDGKREIL